MHPASHASMSINRHEDGLLRIFEGSAKCAGLLAVLSTSLHANLQLQQELLVALRMLAGGCISCQDWALQAAIIMARMQTCKSFWQAGVAIC
jgi:hypothetical protein